MSREHGSVHDRRRKPASALAAGEKSRASRRPPPASPPIPHRRPRCPATHGPAPGSRRLKAAEAKRRRAFLPISARGEEFRRLRPEASQKPQIHNTVSHTKSNSNTLPHEETRWLTSAPGLLRSRAYVI